jgi:hypothetical protein
MNINERNKSLLRQLLHAATLTIGFGTLWSMLALWLATAIQDARLGPQSTWPPGEDFVVMANGTPLIRRTPYADPGHSTYRDLNGLARIVADINDLVTGVYLTDARGTPSFFAAKPGWAERIKRFVDDGAPGSYWYFMHDGQPEGAGYFVGFERTSNRRIGYIGLSGSRSQYVPVDDWIPVRSPVARSHEQWSSAPYWIYSGRRSELTPNHADLPPRLVYVPSGNRLRQVDLATRTVRTVLEAPEPIESLAIPVLGSFVTGPPSIERPILVRTSQQIYALNHKHEIKSAFTIPTEAGRRSGVSWYETADGAAYAEFYRPGSGAGNSDPRVVYRVASDGTIRDRFEVALQSGIYELRQQEFATQLPLLLPVPAMLLAVEPFVAPAAEQTPSYWAGVRAMTIPAWLFLTVVVAFSLVLAAAGWRKSRAFGLSQREQVAWVVFIVLFGVPGYVGYLVHRRWPNRQQCPSCQVQSPRDRPACAECGTAFPEPVLKGTEIFA